MLRLLAICLAALALSPAPALAQTFPDKRVTLVIPFPPGASNDIIGRYLAEGLSRIWKQPVVVENRPGAGGSIGSNGVAKSKPDGYTLSFTSSSYTVNSVVQSNLPFDPVKDLRPVAIVATGQMIAVTGTRVPMPDMKELATQARAQTIFYGANGASLTTFAAELFNAVAGVKMEAVNYKGGSDAISDLLGGRIDAYFGTVTSVQPHVLAKRMTAVAILSKTRSPLLPDVPTVAEAGFPGAETVIWWGVLAPGQTPAPILAKIHADISAVMGAPEAKEFLAKHGAEPAVSSQEDFEKTVGAELARWKALAEKHGIKGR